MYTIDNLPKGYSELKILNLCSNKMIGGGFPFALNGGLPLIIGQGNTPTIWLQAVKDSNPNELILLVDENVATTKEISVTKPEEGVLEIYFNNIKILRVKSTSIDSAVISTLDLRPIGLNILGNQFELKVGGSSFSGNTIQGAKVFLGLG